MKRYQFKLSNVLRVRKVAEEHARAALREAQDEADRATAELETRLAAVGAARPIPGRRTTSEFQEEREQLERHRRAVLAARSAEAHALALLGARHAEWQAAAQEVRALERLDERQRSDWILEVTRAAQLATDEIATIRHHAEER